MTPDKAALRLLVWFLRLDFSRINITMIGITKPYPHLRKPKYMELYHEVYREQSSSYGLHQD